MVMYPVCKTGCWSLEHGIIHGDLMGFLMVNTGEKNGEL